MLEELRKKSGGTVLLGELCDTVGNTGFTVPDYQRNYKWDRETAVKLLTDLIDSYRKGYVKTLALITLCFRNGELHILDGQQRLITIRLILQALGQQELAESRLKLRFSRDLMLEETEKRSTFIRGLGDAQEYTCACSDKRRLEYNYGGIAAAIENDGRLDVSEYSELARHIFDNTQFLLQVTDTDPVKEFLNLNCYKTGFSVCDTVRSKLVSFYTLHRAFAEGDRELRAELCAALDDSDYRKSIVGLFEELTGLLYDDRTYLFAGKERTVYSIVSSGIKKLPEETRENRLNIMFAEFAGGSGYSADDMDVKLKRELSEEEGMLRWVLKLHFCRDMLKELKQELDSGVFTSLKLFDNYRQQGRLSFFELLRSYSDSGGETGRSGTRRLPQVLSWAHSIDRIALNGCKKEEQTYLANSLFGMLFTAAQEPRNERETSSIVRDVFLKGDARAEGYIAASPGDFEAIIHTSGKFILNRFNRRSDVKSAGVIGEITDVTDREEGKSSRQGVATVGELLSRKIVIPMIQRDYCMGSHLNETNHDLYRDMLDALIDSWRENCGITLSAVTVRETADCTVVYDGQQRIVTLACLLKILEDRRTEIDFESRDGFSLFFRGFMSAENSEPSEKALSYSAQSVKRLAEVVKKRLAAVADRKGFAEFIRERVQVVRIAASGGLSTAEQYFLDINEGVKLEPYEIFKSRVNDAAEKRGVGKRWFHKLDNSWQDVFFRFRNRLEPYSSYGGEACEELSEMRMLEFIMRMRYWHGNCKRLPAEELEAELQRLVPFGISTDLMGNVAERLAQGENYGELYEYMEALCGRLEGLSAGLSSCPTELYADSCNHSSRQSPYGVLLFSHGTPILNSVICQFVRGLAHRYGFNEKEYCEARKTDVMMWAAAFYLKEAPEKAEEWLQRIAKLHRSQVYCGKPFAYIAPIAAAFFPYMPLPVPGYYSEYYSYSKDVLSAIRSMDREFSWLDGCEPEFPLHNSVMKGVVLQPECSSDYPYFEEGYKASGSGSYVILYRYRGSDRYELRWLCERGQPVFAHCSYNNKNGEAEGNYFVCRCPDCFDDKYRVLVPQEGFDSFFTEDNRRYYTGSVVQELFSAEEGSRAGTIGQ